MAYNLLELSFHVESQLCDGVAGLADQPEGAHPALPLHLHLAPRLQQEGPGQQGSPRLLAHLGRAATRHFGFTPFLNKNVPKRNFVKKIPFLPLFLVVFDPN